MNTTKRTAVVILNWNGKKFLEQFLSGVVRNTADQARIIVADNASTDDSIDYLKTHHPEVEIIAMKENTGFTGGYNRALQLVDSEYLVLLNSDIEVTPGWLNPIIALMDREPTIGACQPKIRDYYRREKFEYAGAAGGYLDKLGYPYCRGRIFQSLETDNGQYDDTRPVFWATGACMVVRNDCYKKLGGLDERFFAHMEEIDFCWRLHRAGYQVYVCPESVVYHVGGGTLHKSNPKKTYLNFRNNLLLLHNNLDGKKFNQIYRKRVILDALAALSFVFTSGIEDFKAVYKAHRDFHQLKKNTHALSSPQLPKSAMDKEFRGAVNSILQQYHILKKRQFSVLPVR
jgi:hypothetical protein